MIFALPLGAFIIGFIETTIIIATLYIFGFFTAKNPIRLKIFLALSYPGIVGIVGGNAGIIFPIPAIIGLPIWIQTLFTAQSDSLAWFPAPFFTAGLGFDGPPDTIAAFFLSDIALFLAWYILARNIYIKTLVAMLTKEQVESIKNIEILLNDKGYKLKQKLKGWVIIEPQGGRKNIATLGALEEYSKSI